MRKRDDLLSLEGDSGSIFPLYKKTLLTIPNSFIGKILVKFVWIHQFLANGDTQNQPHGLND